MIDKAQAILSLEPESKFVIRDGVIEWLSSDIDKPSDDEIDAEMKGLETEYVSQTYARKRAEEYPSIAELTVALYDEDDKIAIEAKRAAVKKKWPKDNSGPVE